MYYTLMQLFVMALLCTFTCIGVGCFAYGVLPKKHQPKAVYIGFLSVYPVLTAFFYITKHYL